ncbi:MAG: outer membrane beta-barrel protein [Salinimicrobium sp.]
MKINNNSSRIQCDWQILLVILICGTISSSYGQSRNEVSFYATGAFSKFDYEVLQDKSDMENGFSFGAGYSYYLSHNWSIGTGAELQHIEGSAYLTSLGDRYPTADTEGEEFEFRYTLENLQENQNAYFLNLPFKFQYETGNITRFYAAAGAKVGFVVESEYNTNVSSLTTSGYYQQYDVELSNPEFAGFGDFGSVEAPNSKLGLQTNLVLNLETGVKFMLKNDQAFYMGLFADYGLKNIQPEESQENLIMYNKEAPANFIKNSLITSESNSKATPYVDEVKTLAFGLKIQYAFLF